MLETVRNLLTAQYHAALCTLDHCVEKCPDSSWNAPVARYPFCQVTFHTLFFLDYYLSQDEPSFLRQSFHLENASFFNDYEQLEYREPVELYERGDIIKYMSYCRQKVIDVLAEETEASPGGPTKFPGRNFSRLELHVYNIRHIQHHAAQLSLRLKLDHQIEINWVGSGWSAIIS